MHVHLVKPRFRHVEITLRAAFEQWHRLHKHTRTSCPGFVELDSISMADEMIASQSVRVTGSGGLIAMVDEQEQASS